MLQSDEGELEPLPLDQSLFYLYQILQGVFHLHSLSILHLDIKGTMADENFVVANFFLDILYTGYVYVTKI